MLKALKWFFGLFSPYVHPFEKKVDKFFKGIKLGKYLILLC